uniref:(California timema) hypothetical protein n=1 Tax=Timema californicum TaxID=61474 RepID=A0A7R9PAF1_TIMCA|nr:unnamed protein product [Timema californicum]
MSGFRYSPLSGASRSIEISSIYNQQYIGGVVVGLRGNRGKRGHFKEGRKRGKEGLFIAAKQKARRRDHNGSLLWFALVVSFGVCAVRLSLSTWTRYQENPTVISMEKNYREWNTTFPAATICPSSHYDEHKIQNFVTNSSFGDPGRITEFIKLLSEATYDTFDRLKNYTDVRIPPENYMDIILQVHCWILVSEIKAQILSK